MLVSKLLAVSTEGNTVCYWAAYRDFFAKSEQYEIGGGYFLMEKPDKHDLSQVVKVNISTINHLDCVYP